MRSHTWKILLVVAALAAVVIIVPNTGSKSLDDDEISPKISAVAVCCSSDWASSRASNVTCFFRPATEDSRPLALAARRGAPAVLPGLFFRRLTRSIAT